jgi:hypothetical protein
MFGKKKEESKEEFCGACVAGVAALAGVGAAGTSKSTSSDKTTRKVVFWFGTVVSLLSIIYLIYALCFQKCSKCV